MRVSFEEEFRVHLLPLVTVAVFGAPAAEVSLGSLCHCESAVSDTSERPNTVMVVHCGSVKRLHISIIIHTSSTQSGIHRYYLESTYPPLTNCPSPESHAGEDLPTFCIHAYQHGLSLPMPAGVV